MIRPTVEKIGKITLLFEDSRLDIKEIAVVRNKKNVEEPEEIILKFYHPEIRFKH